MRQIGDIGLLVTTKYNELSLRPIYCIYGHYRLDNDQLFYIGKGVPKRPYSKHGRSKHWHNIVNKHNYRVRIFQENLIEEDAFIYEIQLIEQLKRSGQFPYLINKTKGGEGNSTPRSEEWRKNHSIKIKQAAIRGAYKNCHIGHKNPFYSKHHSDEVKLKLSLLKRNPISCTNTITGETFTVNGTRKASTLTKINRTAISVAIKTFKTINDWHFRRICDY